MKILYINLMRGCGVYFIGCLFLDILSKINGIEQIDVYTLQCLKHAKDFNFDSDYDICFFNDSPSELPEGYTYTVLLKKIKQKNIPIINIGHNCGFEDKDQNFDYQFVLNGYNLLYKNIFSINFVTGNIYGRKNKPIYLNDFLIPVRANKIDFQFLEVFKQQNPNANLDVYCINNSPDIQQLLYKYRDIVNYKGFVETDKMVEVYNQYQNVLIPSRSECLCMPAREALLCDCRVFSLVKKGYYDFTHTIKEYIYRLNENVEIISQPEYPVPYPFKEKFNFNNMVLQFLLYLRGIVGNKFFYEKNNNCHIKYITPDDSQNDKRLFFYANKTVDWDKFFNFIERGIENDF